MPTLVCIETGIKRPAKSSWRKNDKSTRQGGIEATRKRPKKKCNQRKPDANGEVAAINGGVGKKAESIPQAAATPIEKVANPQADAFGSNNAVTTHGSDIVKNKTETEASETTIAVNPDEGTTAADNNNEAITVNDKDFFTLSGIDPAGNIIRPTLKFVPMNKTKFLAALEEKGIRYNPKYWKGPQHDYILERGIWPTKNADGHSTALASLYLNDAVHEMFELSFQDPTSSSAPHTVDFQNVLSTQHHTVFVNGIKLSQSHCNTVPIKDSDILHFFNHNIHPQFAFAFTVELSVNIELF